eukprot:1190935-Prorocentrum_minimum.AAC.5
MRGGPRVELLAAGGEHLLLLGEDAGGGRGGAHHAQHLHGLHGLSGRPRPRRRPGQPGGRRHHVGGK